MSTPFKNLGVPASNVNSTKVEPLLPLKHEVNERQRVDVVNEGVAEHDVEIAWPKAEQGPNGHSPMKNLHKEK